MNWMFKALPAEQMVLEEILVEEIPSNESIEKEKEQEKPRSISPSLKDRMIVYLVFFLLGVSTLTLVIYIVMLLFNFQNEGKVLNIFFFTLSPLIGYFLGTNKERGGNAA
jgi:hypothetical protein